MATLTTMRHAILRTSSTHYKALGMKMPQNMLLTPKRRITTYLHNSQAYSQDDKFAWEIAEDGIGMKRLNNGAATALRSDSVRYANYMKHTAYGKQNIAYASKTQLITPEYQQQIAELTKDPHTHEIKQTIYWYKPLQMRHVEGWTQLTEGTEVQMRCRRLASCDPHEVNPLQ